MVVFLFGNDYVNRSIVLVQWYSMQDLKVVCKSYHWTAEFLEQAVIISMSEADSITFFIKSYPGDNGEINLFWIYFFAR